MSRIYKLIFLPFFILGCKPNVIEENKITQRINNLDMNVFSMRGEKIYSMTSPYSSFDKNQLKFQSKNTNINIFNGEEIKYIINSDESTLSDNNKLLKLKGNVKLKTVKRNQDVLEGDNFIWNIEETDYLLKGNVRLKTINENEDILYADNFIWNIEDNNYLLEGNIRFENNNIILNSEKAKLGADNIIEFFNPVKYLVKDKNYENKYEINSENAYYNLKTESVSFEGKDNRVRSIIYF